MNLKELAELKRNSRYEEIAAWADETGLEAIADGSFLLFAAEAYDKLGHIEQSIQAYQRALEEYEEEEAAEQLTTLYTRVGDVEALEKLAEKLEEEGLADDCILRARFEAARISDKPTKEQMILLMEYADTFYEERYFILLLELLLHQDVQKFHRYLIRFRELFTNSIYEEYAVSLEQACQEGRTEPEKTIRELLYPGDNGSEPSVIEEAVSEPEREKEAAPRTKSRSLKDLMSNGFFQGMVKKKKTQHREPPTMEERFADVVGMEEVRAQIGNLYRVMKLEMERQDADFGGELLKSTHFTIDGAHGMGKTLLAETISQMLVDFGIRSEEQAVSIEGKDFCDNYDELEKLDDLTLIVENVDRCMDDQGKFGEFSWKLQKFLNDHRQNLSVIITGTKDAVLNLLGEERNIKEAVYASFSIPEYSTDELIKMFEIIARQRGWILTEDAWKLVRRQLEREKKMSVFAGGKTIEEKLKLAQSRAADRNAQLEDAQEKDLVTLEVEDFAQEGVDANVPQLLEQLDNMIGLTGVKKQVQRLIQEQMVNKEAEDAGSERATGGKSLHMIFKGSPGTGKTTVARIIAKIYMAMGVLPGNKEGMVETSPSDLIGQYVGETGKRTQAVIDRAMGGVLFVDEAYMFMQNQFGAEAINVMLKVIEDSRDSIMFIFAGYSEDIDKFLDMNPGLRSRIPTQVMFEDYTQEEMCSIFRNIVREDHFYLDKDTTELVKQLIAQESKGQDFGNARGVRNLVKQTETALNERLSEMAMDQKLLTVNDYEIIRKVDIQAVLEHATDGAKTLDELLAELNDMEGMADLKAVVNATVNTIRAGEAMKKIGMDNLPEQENLHMVFLGGPGTGKTTMARKVGYIYKALGILPRGDQILECSRPELVAEYQGQTDKKVMDAINHSMGGILFIDEAYTLSNDDSDSFGKEAIDTLVKSMEDKRGQFMVILAGYTDKMDHFLDQNPGLRSRIPHMVNFVDYSPEQLKSIFIKMAAAKGLTLEPGSEKVLEALLKEKSAEKDFGNARGVRNVLGKVSSAINTRIVELGEAVTAEDCRTIRKQDMQSLMQKKGDKQDQTVEELLQELDDMIGLGAVKKAVHEIVDMAKYNVLAEQNGWGGSNDKGSLHLLFKGNAGTGKTTVARKLGKIYYKLGVLRTDEFVECDRKTLVAGYVGQTGPQTQKYIDQALGGILFVDEAYTLCQGGENDFGMEALTTIMKAMEDNRDDLMVIFAGYSEEIDELIAKNQGLESRFSKQNEIIFEDYTDEELLQIFLYQMKNLGVHVEEVLYPKLQEKIASAKADARNFGNARGIRNLVEAIDRKRRGRIVRLTQSGNPPTQEEAMQLAIEDIEI